ncbi:MAG: DNA polymerase III subunit delta' [Ruaniaceae bacterium]|nr:DNA polymerase III subunit delta' [Ruaniaceae bacterium]
MSVFDALVGQEHVIEVLERAVADPRSMTHAWLFTGPPGSGRSVAARAFAAALQCERGGCGECRDCRQALNGTHPDVTYVTTDKVIIDIREVRELVTIAARSASQGRWRIIVIEDADRMVERTSNVLLKAIEEPAERTVWLLCAPSQDDVMVTIRSRCRPVALRIPPAEAVAELLVTRDGVDPATALAAARAAQSHIGIAKRLATNPEAADRRRAIMDVPGSIRGVADAVLVAARLMERASEEATAVATERDAAEKAALMRTFGIAEGDKIPPQLRSQIRTLQEDQKRRATRVQRDALDRVMVDLLSFYRDVAARQLGSRVELVNADFTSSVEQIAADSSSEQTLRRIEAIQQARRRLDANVAPLLAVEAMCVGLRPQG